MSSTRVPNNQNKMDNSTGKGSYSPPSGKFSPPAPGAHAPKSVHHIGGGESAPKQSAGVHHSLKRVPGVHQPAGRPKG
jgi:hypothetical protein